MSRIISVSGVVDGEKAEKLVATMNEKEIYTLDFCDVTEVKFAALRVLLNCRRSGRRFCVVNAETGVAERFEDTGVSVFVNICRKPKPLQLGKYDEFGASFLSKAYNSEDGDAMIKVYGSRVPKWLVAQEKAIARAVMVFGIPTPLVGTLYEDGEQMGLDFERIEGKKSFSRIMQQEPERVEEMSRRFARMCKQLHNTECDTSIFIDRKIYYRQAVVACKELSEDIKSNVLAFIDAIPDETTCLHGDMQPGNVITNGKEDFWIDLSDFGYGNHMLDMGMWFFLSQLNDERNMQHIFNFGKDVMDKVWYFFAEEYFGADTEAKQAEIRATVIPYAALHMIYLGATYGFQDDMLNFIRTIFCR